MVGDLVYAGNISGLPMWILGIFVTVSGPLSYVVELSDGTNYRHHIDQLRSREAHEVQDQELFTRADEILRPFIFRLPIYQS